MQVKEKELSLPTNPFLWPFVDVQIFEGADSSPKFFCSVPLLKFSEDIGIQTKNNYLRMIGRNYPNKLTKRVGRRESRSQNKRNRRCLIAKK
jgi:hypothetical protein